MVEAMAMEFLSLVLLVFVASAVGTFSGFGTSTIMVPILLLFYPSLSFVLLFVAIVHWFGDVWKIALFRKGVRQWRLITWFAVPGMAASLAGAAVSVAAPQEVLLRILGVFLLVYVAFLFFRRNWQLPQKNSTAGLGGMLSGFAAGIFGVGGAIRGAALAAFNLPKEVYLFTSGAAALAIDSTRIAGYLAGGERIEGIFLWGMVLFIPASFAGALLAKRFVDRIPQRYFRLFIAVFLAGVGLKFLLFP